MTLGRPSTNGIRASPGDEIGAHYVTLMNARIAD
jgi:hypothetical protein